MNIYLGFYCFLWRNFVFHCQIDESKRFEKAYNIAFSGNGAKTLRVLSANNNTIGQFAKLIFDGVYGTEGRCLDIIFEEEPKTATCKGGILNSKAETPADIKKIKFTLLGNDMNSILLIICGGE